VILLLIASCSSRKKTLEISEYRSAEVTKIDTNTVISSEKKIQNTENSVKKSDQKIKENEGDIIIKGKTDSAKDFHFHNIVEGDTLSDIYMSGNSDFIIKNRWKKIDKKEVTEIKSETLNIIAEVARKSVAQSTMKEVAQELKTKEVMVKSTGFSLPVYLIIGGAVLFLILLFFLWKKFGGGIIDRLNLKR